MPDPQFTDWGSPHNAGQIPPEWLQQIVAYLIQHPLPGGTGKASGSADGTSVVGAINADGSVAAGTGFTCQRTGTGRYLITFDPAFSAPPSVLATVAENSNRFIFVPPPTTNDSC